MIDIDTLLTQGLELSPNKRYTDASFVKPLEALINALNQRGAAKPRRRAVS